MKKRINIADKHRDILVSEFNISRQTVYNAVRYFTESALADKIRKRAKELLIQEADEVIITINQE